MADKKPAPKKKVFTATSKTEKQQNFTARTGTADMRSKAKPAPKAAKPIIGRTSQDPKVKAQINEKMKKAPTIKISGSSSAANKNKPSASMNKAVSGNKGSNPLKAVVKRVGTVAREAGDVVNAVKTAGKVAGIAAGSRSTGGLGAAAKNVARQVGETARAAATGKSGTTSGTAARELTPARGSGKNAKTSADLKWVTKGAVVKPGKKRK